MPGMSLRHALLGLLNYGSASGYDLMHTFNTSLANVWPANQSQVYGELGRLTDAGLLEVRAAAGPRGRKEYSITDTGRAELAHWLADVEPNRAHRNEPLLRVFFLGVLSQAQAIDYLREESDLAGRRLERYREMAGRGTWDANDLAIYGRLALEYGLRLMIMQREWAAWAIGHLEGRQAAAATGHPRANPT